MKARPRKPVHGTSGFTVAELLVAMTISGIVLAAVATLAFATGKADTAMDDLLTKQKFAQYNSLRIRDALRYSRRVFATPDGNKALWQDVEDGGADNRINGSELIFLRTVGSDLRLYAFAFDRPDGKAVKETTISTLGEAGPDDPIRLDIAVAEVENDTAFDALSTLAAANQYVRMCSLAKLPDRYNPDVCEAPGVKIVFSNVCFTSPANGSVNLTYDMTVKRVNASGRVMSQATMKYNLPAVLLCSANNTIINGEIVSDDD